MGYSTNFTGRFDLDKQLTLDDYRILKGLEGFDPRDCEEAAGVEALPDSYCQWGPTEDGRGVAWDGSEKFYKYTEWLQYIINKILAPKGYVLTGQVAFQGEDTGDCGIIIIEDGKVFSRKYVPQDDDLKSLVEKGLAECDEDEDAYWYLEQIAKKLGIK